MRIAALIDMTETDNHRVKQEDRKNRRER